MQLSQSRAQHGTPPLQTRARNLVARADACRQPKPEADLKQFDGWEASDKQFQGSDTDADRPAAPDGPYASTPAKQAGSTALPDMLSPPSLGAAEAIAEMCRASMSGPLAAAASSAEFAEPRALPAGRSVVIREHCNCSKL